MQRFLLFPAIFLLGTVAVYASVDNDLLALVPASAQTVGGIDVTRAQGSAFGQFTLNRLDQNDENFSQFIDQTGFDPRRDLQQVMFASSGLPTAKGPGNFVVLARGVFDISRIKSTAKAKGSTERMYHAWDLILNKNAGHHASALVFPQADVALFGEVGTIEQILDNSTSPSSLDPGVQKQIAAVGPNNDAWFVSVSGANWFVGNLNGDNESSAQKALQSVLQSSGGIRFGSTVDISLDSVTRSPQDATSLADVVRLGASMFQMQRQKDQRAAILAGALDKMTLQATGSQVHLAFSLPEKDLERLSAVGPHPVAHLEVH